MRTGNRKSAPEVKGGKVQKKNDWALTPDYYNTSQALPVIDRKRPGEGYRHLLRKKDIYDFIALLPDWSELSVGLNAIVLAPGSWRLNGYYTTGRAPAAGVVHVCAWDGDPWQDYKRDTNFFRNHEPIFQRLGVPTEYSDDGYALCKFDEDTARAYQLLHILLHELGHHHDLITSRNKKNCGRGEPYAEAYALAYEAQVWDAYRRKFDLP